MDMNKKTIAIWSAIGLLLLASAWFLSGWLYHRSPSVAKAATETRPRELNASPEFLTQYQVYLALQKEVVAKQVELQSLPQVKEVQAKQDQLSGMVQRLSAAIPGGYQFDPQQNKFFLVSPISSAPVTQSPPAKKP
jgi:hypothetical protein